MTPNSARPSVSVVMSVFNGERYLSQAIDSVLRQTLADFEFIIIDDGSTDPTQVILREYASADSRIHLLRNDTNIGLTRSLNRGLAATRGEYIARQDADDVSYPTRLQEQVAWLNLHRDIGLLGTHYDVIDDTGRCLDSVTPPTDDSHLQQALLLGNCFGHGTTMIRRQFLSLVGGYSEDLPYSQDYDLWLRLAERCEIANLNQRLYGYRFHSRSASVAKLGDQLDCAWLGRTAAYVRRGIELAQAEDEVTRHKQSILAHLRNCYFSYLCDDPATARSLFDSAYFLASRHDLVDVFEKQVCNFADRIAENSETDDDGVEFIRAMLGSEAGYPRSVEAHILAGHYVNLAFRDKSKGSPVGMRNHLHKAIKHQPTWLLNQGVQSMLFIALSGRSPRQFLSQLLPCR